MTFYMIDVEATGQSPAVAEMSAFGSIAVPRDEGIYLGFLGIANPILYGNRSPVSPKVSCKTVSYNVMQEFAGWIGDTTNGQPIFISDNNGWDYQWINYYFWKFLGRNPFGHSSYNLGSLYKGLVRNLRKNFKHLRDTKHDHNPVNDCLGNVEAVIKLWKEYGLS